MRRIVILNDYTSNPRVTISRRNIRSYLHCTRFAMASLTARFSASCVAVDRRKPIPLSFNQLRAPNALFVSHLGTRLAIASLTTRFSASLVAVARRKLIPLSLNHRLASNARFVSHLGKRLVVASSTTRFSASFVAVDCRNSLSTLTFTSYLSICL